MVLLYREGIDVKKNVWGRGGFIKKKVQATPTEYQEGYDDVGDSSEQRDRSNSKSETKTENVDRRTDVSGWEC